MRTPKKLYFWEQVKKLIRDQKISQEKLAARIGINSHTLKFWMCYGYYPDVGTAYKIADVLGVPLDLLMKRKTIKKMKAEASREQGIETAVADIKRMVTKIEEKVNLLG